MSSYKKIIFFISLILMITVLLPYQLIAENKDSVALSRKLIISVGCGGPAVIYIDNWINNGYKIKGDQKVVTQTNPIYAKVEYRIFRHLGIGVDASYNDYEAKQTPSSSTNYTTAYKGYTLYTAIRLNRHIHLVHKKLDLYCGVGLGYQIQSINNIIINKGFAKSGSNSMAFELTFGARYYFTKRIGIYIEGGLARSIIQGGLAIRL